MTPRVLRGRGAAGGVALGHALTVFNDEPQAPVAPGGGAEDQARAVEAFGRVADRLDEVARGARDAGRRDVADVLDTSALIASDPVLLEDVHELAASMSAVDAVREATERHAARLRDTGDPLLADRATDLRGIGRRAAAMLAHRPPILSVPDRPTVLVAHDLSPADVAELELSAQGWVCGVALVDGTPTSHVTIMARSLGLPVAVGVGDGLLAVCDGEEVAVDGDRGIVVLAVDDGVRGSARDAADRVRRTRFSMAATRHLPATTRDGHHVALLCNASTEAEIRVGLAAGAEGVGLLRTEMLFLDARGWPPEPDHLTFMEIALESLDGAPLTVRTLDFGADKLPPFLAGERRRGLALSLSHPEGLSAQLRAILRAGGCIADRLRILLPFVESGADVAAARALMAGAADAVGWPAELPPLGAMVETRRAVDDLDAIAGEAQFLSIGTNDLVPDVLGIARGNPVTDAARPEVLELLARIVATATGRGTPVGVCGEAAGEPALSVLVCGMGVSELSVSATSVDAVRTAIRGVALPDAVAAAHDAQRAGSADAALERAGELLSAELRDQGGQLGDRLGGIVA